MNIIFLDSSSDNLKIAFYNNNNDYFKQITNDKNDRSSDNLVKIFNELLKQTNTKINDLDVLICITGPGSFTGIRTCLSFINGLASGLKLQNKEIKIIPLTLFQVCFISNIKNITAIDTPIIKIPSNKINKIFVQQFNNKTHKSIDTPKEIDIDTIISYEKNQIINYNSDYDLKIIMKYISKNISLYETDKNIIPCYIRQHYGIPKNYIIRNEKTNNLNKIIISNEENDIGFIEYQTCDTTIEIINFEIKYQYRGIGAGKYLLKIFISEMKQKNFKKILLDVRSKNIIAQNLYKNFGFITDGIRKNYYHKTQYLEADDAILMSLIIK